VSYADVVSARVVAPVVVLAAVLAVVACSKKAGACDVDADCGDGSFCRDALCTVVGSDGGADGEVPGQCADPGSSCTSDNDCCSPPCNASQRCAGTGGTSGKSSSGTSGTSSGGTSGTSGTTSSGGNCQDLYALCSFDGECCPGLSCDPNGSCR
jgi:hypothetical protein